MFGVLGNEIRALPGRNPARWAGRNPRRWRGRNPTFGRTGAQGCYAAAHAVCGPESCGECGSILGMLGTISSVASGITNYEVSSKYELRITSYEVMKASAQLALRESGAAKTTAVNETISKQQIRKINIFIPER